MLVIAISVASVLVLIQVFMMRYNVVTGGQEITKAMRGYLDHYVPSFGIEGALAALTVTKLSLPGIRFSTIFTIGFVDNKLIDEVEACNGGDAALLEGIKT